jgi:regulator of sigma E protease
MEGEDEASNDPRSFNKVPATSRIAVVAAGAIMNFVLAILVLTIVSYGAGMPTNVIQETITESPAQQAGIKSGDAIISINDENISSWNKIVKSINASNPNEEMKITVLRDGEKIDFEVKPVVEENKTIIGIVPSSIQSISSAIRGGFEKTGMFLKLMFQFVGMIFKGQVSTKDLSGPVGVIHEVGQAAKYGFLNLLYIMGFISVNLGFFNLLPIPALDGSRIMFLLIEIVRGKPVDAEKEGFFHFVGFVLLILLMIVVTYRDIIKFQLFRG